MTGPHTQPGEASVISGNVEIQYTNHHGETETRKIRPIGLFLKSTQWHPQEQWILEAYAYDRSANRSFAMNDIHGWKQVD